MPMDFPDMASLIEAPEVHKFRKPADGETEEGFRGALADHVQPIDFVESLEIRNKVGWDKFSTSQSVDMLQRSAAKTANTLVAKAAHAVVEVIDFKPNQK